MDTVGVVMNVALFPEPDGEKVGRRVGVMICDADIDPEREESKEKYGDVVLDPKGE